MIGQLLHRKAASADVVELGSNTIRQGMAHGLRVSGRRNTMFLMRNCLALAFDRASTILDHIAAAAQPLGPGVF